MNPKNTLKENQNTLYTISTKKIKPLINIATSQF